MKISTPSLVIELETQEERNAMKEMLLHAKNNPPSPNGFPQSYHDLAQAVANAISSAPQDG